MASWEVKGKEFDCTYPTLPPGLVPQGCRHPTRVGKLNLRCGKAGVGSGFPRSVTEVGAVGFSDSLISRLCWESLKSREWSWGPQAGNSG